MEKFENKINGRNYANIFHIFIRRIKKRIEFAAVNLLWKINRQTKGKTDRQAENQ